MKKSYIRHFFLLYIFLFLGNPLSAKTVEENSLLWKISGKNLKQESYLFGTIHIICKEQFRIDQKIENALNASSKLALEINMADPNLMIEMQKLSVNSGMKNIQSEFAPEDAASINDFLVQHFGVGLAQLGILKPFVLSSMIMMKKLPCEEQSGYEMYFVEKAKEQEMEIVGLETVDFQFKIFDEIPQKLQLEGMTKLVKDPNSMDEYKDMVAAYQRENIDELYDLITKNEMFNEYEDILLKQRNENWIAGIETLIEKQPTFIAVGAGHLGSENGVISLLRKAGYTVEPVYDK